MGELLQADDQRIGAIDSTGQSQQVGEPAHAQVDGIHRRRFEPLGALLLENGAHLLGTIGEISKQQLGSRRYAGYRAGETVGQSGLEKLLEADLRGRAGGRNVVVDVAGRVVRGLIA